MSSENKKPEDKNEEGGFSHNPFQPAPNLERKVEKPKDLNVGPLFPDIKPRGKVYESILDTIGATPMVKLPHLTKKYSLEATILAKLECFNPLASVKDRIGFAMIEAAEKAGLISPDKTTLVEPTSGNTGIALAFVAATKGYRIILTMPESMSLERQKMLKFYGAELELTPAERGMKGAIERAYELADEIENAYMPMQFDNPANPQIHRETTAEEIWADTNGEVDVFISGVGTGGTLTGVSQVLKERNPEMKTYAVEPADSPVLSGGDAGPHKIQGIGAGFIPSILETKFIDGVVKITNERAFEMAREAAKVDGIPCGISSGAAIAAAIDIAKMPEHKGKNIVAIIPSFAERYISTALFDFD